MCRTVEGSQFASLEHLGEPIQVAAHLVFIPILEVPNSTRGVNVGLFHGWDQEAGDLQMLWYTGILSVTPSQT